MSIQLHGRATSANVQKVLWLLDELGLAFERIDVGGPFGGNRTEEYLAMNPNGVVPTLVDGGVVVWESNSVLRYLCNRYDGQALYPVDAVARSHVERWMDWQLTVINLANAFLFQGIVRTPPEQRDEARIERLRLENVAAFGLLEAQLSRHDHVAGPALSIADICLGSIVHRWFNLPIERPVYPHVRLWYDRLRQRPGFQRYIDLPLA